jgi:hypothetical protein
VTFFEPETKEPDAAAAGADVGAGTEPGTEPGTPHFYRFVVSPTDRGATIRFSMVAEVIDDEPLESPPDSPPPAHPPPSSPADNIPMLAVEKLKPQVGYEDTCFSRSVSPSSPSRVHHGVCLSHVSSVPTSRPALIHAAGISGRADFPDADEAIRRGVGSHSVLVRVSCGEPA